MTNLQEQLAAALELSSDDILTFKPYPDGYAVITADMRKFSGVQPTEPKVAAQDAPLVTQDVPLVTQDVPLDTKDVPLVTQDVPLVTQDPPLAPAYPPELPAEYWPVYDNPAEFTVPELRAAAAALNLPHGKRMTKARLVAAIKNHQ